MRGGGWQAGEAAHLQRQLDDLARQHKLDQQLLDQAFQRQQSLLQAKLWRLTQEEVHGPASRAANDGTAGPEEPQGTHEGPLSSLGSPGYEEAPVAPQTEPPGVKERAADGRGE